MNQLLRNLIIVLVIISYSILAASSYSEQEIKAYIGITIGVIVLIGLIYAIVEFVKQKNQEKRNEIKREFENNLIDFPISDKIGDDRCTIYLDKYNNKLKVIAITTDGITEQDIDSVTGDLLFTHGNGRYVIDNVNKKYGLSAPIVMILLLKPFLLELLEINMQLNLSLRDIKTHL